MLKRNYIHKISHKNGVKKIRLESWRNFQDFICDEYAEYKYIYRGQRNSRWRLEPTLDRILRDQTNANIKTIREHHLQCLKRCARGRRGSNPLELNENEWWALGRHFGLVTPLLDWTGAPFLALFFAFEEPDEDVRYRAVWALSRNIHKFQNRIELVEPMVEDNARMVCQDGLFTRSQDGGDIETCINEIYPEEKKVKLLKIEIPNNDRLGCLRFLNRMNINYLSLFPDLYGSCMYANMSLQIQKY